MLTPNRTFCTPWQIYTHVSITALKEVHARTHPHGGPSVPPFPSSPVALESPPIEMVIAAPSPSLSSAATEQKKREDLEGPEDQGPDDSGAPPLLPPKPPQSPSGLKSNTFNDLRELDSREVNDYGYRYFHPELGRWLSRDPIGERGGLNLYAAVNNNFVNQRDVLGLLPPPGALQTLPPYDPLVARDTIPYSEIQQKIDRENRKGNRERQQEILHAECMIKICQDALERLAGGKSKLEQLKRLEDLMSKSTSEAQGVDQDLDSSLFWDTLKGFWGSLNNPKGLLMGHNPGLGPYTALYSAANNRYNEAAALKEYLRRAFNEGGIKNEIKETEAVVDSAEKMVEKCKEEGFLLR